jgi:hypothetical protein
MPESRLSTYSVEILKDSLVDVAYLAEVDERDIAEISLMPDFQCDWATLWSKTDFNCEALVKLTYQGKIQGIVKFALFPPYPLPEQVPEFIEILNLESISGKNRIISPVGLWLIWYVVATCLKVGCVGDSQGSVLLLISVKLAIPYYRDKVRMEGLQWITISPYEEGYAFRFSKNQAIEFLHGTQAEYGEAIELAG